MDFFELYEIFWSDTRHTTHVQAPLCANHDVINKNYVKLPNHTIQ